MLCKNFTVTYPRGRILESESVLTYNILLSLSITWVECSLLPFVSHKAFGWPRGGKKRHSTKFQERRENMEEKSIGRISTFTLILASRPLKCRNLTTGDFSKGQGCWWMVWPCYMGAERRQERWVNGFPFCPHWNHLTFLSTCWERLCWDSLLGRQKWKRLFLPRGTHHHMSNKRVPDAGTQLGTHLVLETCPR